MSKTIISWNSEINPSSTLMRLMLHISSLRFCVPMWICCNNEDINIGFSAVLHSFHDHLKDLVMLLNLVTAFTSEKAWSDLLAYNIEYKIYCGDSHCGSPYVDIQHVRNTNKVSFNYNCYLTKNGARLSNIIQKISEWIVW